MIQSDGASGATVTETERTLLTLPEAADYLRVGKTTLYALMREGQIETIYIGTAKRRGRRVIPLDSLAAFVDRRRGVIDRRRNIAGDA